MFVIPTFLELTVENIILDELSFNKLKQGGVIAVLQLSLRSNKLTKPER